jgi:hypothetical protein
MARTGIKSFSRTTPDASFARYKYPDSDNDTYD